MDISHSPLAHLTPAQRSALYEQARQEAVELRRQAMHDFAAWLASRMHGLWRRAARAFIAAPKSQETLACPR
jgi:hypothetical protein